MSNTLILTVEGADLLAKAGARAIIGEIRMFGGRQYIRSVSGWKFYGRGLGKKSQQHISDAKIHNHVEVKLSDRRAGPLTYDIEVNGRAVGQIQLDREGANKLSIASALIDNKTRGLGIYRKALFDLIRKTGKTIESYDRSEHAERAWQSLIKNLPADIEFSQRPNDVADETATEMIYTLSPRINSTPGGIKFDGLLSAPLWQDLCKNIREHFAISQQQLDHLTPQQFNNQFCDFFAELISSQDRKMSHETTDEHRDALIRSGIKHPRAHAFLATIIAGNVMYFDIECQRGVHKVSDLPFFQRQK